MLDRIVAPVELDEPYATQARREEARTLKNQKRAKAAIEACLRGEMQVFKKTQPNVTVVFVPPITEFSIGRILLLQEFVANATGIFMSIVEVKPTVIQKKKNAGMAVPAIDPAVPKEGMLGMRVSFRAGEIINNQNPEFRSAFASNEAQICYAHNGILDIKVGYSRVLIREPIIG